MQGRDSNRKGWSWSVVILLTVAALALRLTGVGFRLPQTPQPDEQEFHLQIAHQRGVEIPEYKRVLLYCYPMLLAQGLELATREAESAPPNTLEEHRARAARELVVSRTLLAILTALGVPLTFVLARRFLPDGGALLAAALLTTSVLHGWYSPQARPHGPLSTFTLLAVLAAMHLARHPSAAVYAWAGVTAGLAVGVLQNGAFVLPALGVAHVLRARERKLSRATWLLALLPILLIAWNAYRMAPFEDGQPHAPVADHGFYLLEVQGVQRSEFDGSGFSAILAALWNFEPLVFLLALAGAGIGAANLVTRGLRATWAARAENLRDSAIVLAHALPYLLAFGLFARTYQRYMLPIQPYLCCLAAYALLRFSRWMAARVVDGRGRAVLEHALPISALALQSFAAVKVAILRSSPDTESLAAAWIRTHVAADAERISLAPSLELPLLCVPGSIDDESLHDKIGFKLWMEYQASLAPRGAADPGAEISKVEHYDIQDAPLQRAASRAEFLRDPSAFVRSLDARWFVVYVPEPGRREFLRAWRDAVRSQGVLCARFAPRAHATGDVPIRYEQDGALAPDDHFVWRALRFEAQGPEIEIYRLER